MIQEERLLLERLLKTNRLHGLYREGDRVLLALSGGPDSAALAALFSSLPKNRRPSLFAAHLNHGLSAQAARFEAAARKIASRFRLPFSCARVDVGVLAKRSRVSVEEAGRKARYDFFIQTARRLRIDAVATAHTRDDQIETVLFRIFRGTSLHGLSGIPYARDERGARIIRPLLDCGKKELLAYVSASKIPFCIDRSNRSMKHRRNRIRHEILPFLEKRLNPRVGEAVARLQQSWLEYSPTLSRAVDRAWKACRARRKTGELTVDRAAFARLDDALKQELFLRAAETLGAGRKALRRVHVEAARALEACAGRTATHFPDFTVTVGAKRIAWRRKRIR